MSVDLLSEAAMISAIVQLVGQSPATGKLQAFDMESALVGLGLMGVSGSE